MSTPADGPGTDSRETPVLWSAPATRVTGFALLYLRLALGTAFLSAVGDRFGWWGPPGTPLVAWGNFHNFLAYTAVLNPWFASGWIPVVGWIATVCELIFGILLILGLYTRIAAFLSGLLVLAFAIGMSVGIGIKAPLDASVFSASAGGFLLACIKNFPMSLDSLRFSHRPADYVAGRRSAEGGSRG